MGIDDFLNIEAKYNILNQEFKGFYFWQYIRFKIYSECVYGTSQIEQEKKKHNVFDIIKYILFKSLITKTKKKDVFIRASARQITDDETHYGCLQTNELIKSFRRPYVLNVNYSIKKNNLAHRDIAFATYTADLRIIIKFCRKLFFNRISQKNKIVIKNKLNRELVQEINQTFNGCIDYEKLCDLVNSYYFDWHICKKYYKYVLKKIKPKLIIEVVGYNFENMVINEVAKELKIPVVELQHGIMGEGHIAYNYHEKADLKIFPDYIFTYSEFWNLDTRFPISRDKIIPTGFPFMEKTVEEYKSKEAISKNKDLITILMISQYNMGNLADFTVELYDLLIKEYKGKFKIIYKMHPRENLNSFDSYQKLREYSDRIEVVENETKSMYKCFGEADIQVGVSTTGLYEGLAFDLDTYILCGSGSERLKSLVDLKLAKLIKKPSDLLVSLLNGENENNIKDVGVLWKENAFDNISIEIEKIIKRGY